MNGVRVISVDAASATYDVVVGRGVLGEVGQRCAAVLSARRVALVTDETVAALFGTAVDLSLARAGFEVHALRVPPGEGAKTWATAGALLEAFADAGIERTDAVVALGGGVVGDLAGFAAATYLRGVDVVQVPTTLLAQVDAAIGGKTAVDLAAGKNLAGAFKQPKLVLADTEALDTLPDVEWRSGLAEVAKSAIIDSEEFCSWLESNTDGLRDRDPAAVDEAVARSAAFKARVVSGDEREQGLRECLNYGHTFGHAIEKVAGYGSVPHGVAVAEGMRFAARLGVDARDTGRELVARQDVLLDALGLPPLERAWAVRDLFQAMRSDKKARDGQIRFVLAQRPGVWSCEPVADRLVIGQLESWAASKEGT